MEFLDQKIQINMFHYHYIFILLITIQSFHFWNKSELKINIFLTKPKKSKLHYIYMINKLLYIIYLNLFDRNINQYL